MTHATRLKYLILVCLGVVLSSATFVFGSVPMNAVRGAYGRGAYWLTHVVVSAAMFAVGLQPLSIAYLSLAVLVGVYTEVAEHSESVFSAAMTAILATLGALALAVGGWLIKTKASWTVLVQNEVQSLVDQMAAVNPELKVSPESLISILPSVVVITLVLALVVALLWERQMFFWFRLVPKEHKRRALSDFRVPDAIVWLAILAALGAFVDMGKPGLATLSMNVFNIVLVVYFLQGMAVLSRVFRAYRVSPFWQAIWYVLMVLQLFPLVSAFGFSDYWLNYRERIAKKIEKKKI